MEDNSLTDDIVNEITDINLIELHMIQFGNGEISLLNTYWNEGIAIIQINNPAKKNAISGKMMGEFRKCISELESWKEGKAVILYGLGDNFCSGGDLDFAKQCSSTRDGFYLSCLMQDVLNRLRKLPIVSIALVHGTAIGGGAEIAVSCDFILACKDVKLGFVHGKMGIITAWGGTTRLVQALGEKQALELLLSSRILQAEECLKLSLVTKILDNDEKLEQCLKWAREHTRHHYSVTRAFKQATIITSQKYDQHLETERQLFLPLWGGSANKEALKKNIKHISNKNTSETSSLKTLE